MSILGCSAFVGGEMTRKLRLTRRVKSLEWHVLTKDVTQPIKTLNRNACSFRWAMTNSVMEIEFPSIVLVIGRRMELLLSSFAAIAATSPSLIEFQIVICKRNAFVNLKFWIWFGIECTSAPVRPVRVTASATKSTMEYMHRVRVSPSQSQRTLFSMPMRTVSRFGVACAGTHAACVSSMPWQSRMNDDEYMRTSCSRARVHVCECIGARSVECSECKIDSSEADATPTTTANMLCSRWYCVIQFFFSLAISSNATTEWQFTCSSRLKRTHTARTAVAKSFRLLRVYKHDLDLVV